MKRRIDPSRLLTSIGIGAIVLLATTLWLLFLTDRAPGTPAALHGFPLDDAWIHLVYARSLIAEGGFHYNPGVPESGMTSPLWVVCLAAVYALAHGGGAHAVVLGAKILSLGWGAAGVLALALIARQLGEGGVMALVAALLFALDPTGTFTRAAGMEVPLFTALVLFAFLFALRGRLLAAAACAGLSVVARPEGAILLPVLFALLARDAIRAGHHQSLPRARLAGRWSLAVLLAAGPAALYAAFCLHATGHPLPNTFYAKFAPGSPFAWSTFARGWENYVRENIPYFTGGVAGWLALAGAVRLVRRHGARGLAVVAGGILLFTSTLASRTFAEGHFHYWERWLAPSFPFLFLLIAAGIAEVADGAAAIVRRTRDHEPGAGDSRPSRASRLAPLAVTALALVFLLWRLPASLRERADTFAWNCQNIEEMNVAMGRWVAENTPTDAVVAVNDAGAIRYFGGRVTVDLLGLNDHRVVHHDPSLGPSPMKTLGVGYVIVFPYVFREIVTGLPLIPVHELRAPNYTICDAPQDVLVAFRLDTRGTP